MEEKTTAKQSPTFECLDRIDKKLDNLKALLEPVTNGCPVKSEDKPESTRLEGRLSLIETKISIMLDTIAL